MQKNRNSARAARTIQVTPSSNVSPEDDGIEEIEEIALTEVVSEAPIERLVPDENEARPEATKKENPIKAHPSKKIRRVISIWEKVPEDAYVWENLRTFVAIAEKMQWQLKHIVVQILFLNILLPIRIQASIFDIDLTHIFARVMFQRD